MAALSSKFSGAAMLLISLSLNLLLSFSVNSRGWIKVVVVVDAQRAEVKVGVVLDNDSEESIARTRCINMALSDWYVAHPHSNTTVILHFRDSYRHDPVSAADAFVDLIKNEQVVAIIGPETSQEAQFAVNLGERAQVPIISYSATSPFISPSKNPYFVRATQVDSSQVPPLTAFIKAFGWREIVPVYVDDEFGGGIVPLLADTLQQIGTSIPYRSVIPSSASKYQILAELYKLKSLSCRVFIVHMPASLGSQLFLKAEELGLMSQDYVWIITNAMGNVLSNVIPQVIQAMQGVVGLESYVPETRELDDFTVKWRMQFQQENATPNVYGLWAYDATVALARAVEEVGINNFTFTTVGDGPNLSTDIATMGVSQAGPVLLQRILGMRFKGLTGNFVLSDGEIQGSTFRLINIWDGDKKGIGYWTPNSGLIKQLSSAHSGKPGTSIANLESIRWPGDPTSIPRGWVSSSNGKKLRIGVPIKDAFREFVQVTQDVATNSTKVAGFCIDVFNAVMSKLPYSVPYEYIPYTEHQGKPTSSYDLLVSQVYLKNFDVVVGDVTIRSNRATQVDFTLPFSESGVVMIAPFKDNKQIRAWLFVKPLTWDLWLTTFCFFIFIAFVVWVLEHRINEDFRGPPGHQAGTSLYYSFSTIVFSQSFSVFSNLTRFVVIIWVFVLLLLTQSYTASLTSLLTVEQLQPTITDINELKKNGHNVGFQEGSFVRDFLLSKEMGFDSRKLKPFNNTEQLNDLLSKGTAKGGVSAVYHEIPYLKLFMGAHCSKYTIVPPVYKADGFGFVFPRGSPLVSDVSRGVLTVTEGKEMTNLEKKWLQTANCMDMSLPRTSRSLGLDSFWGVFTIAGGAAVTALVISLAGFLKEHEDVWSDSNISVWSRIRMLWRLYDQRKLSSHTFRKGQPADPSFPGTASNTPFAQSPVSYQENSERGFNKYIEQPSAAPPSEISEASCRGPENQKDAAS